MNTKRKLIELADAIKDINSRLKRLECNHPIENRRVLRMLGGAYREVCEACGSIIKDVAESRFEDRVKEIFDYKADACIKREKSKL